MVARKVKPSKNIAQNTVRKPSKKDILNSAGLLVRYLEEYATEEQIGVIFEVEDGHTENDEDDIIYVYIDAMANDPGGNVLYRDEILEICPNKKLVRLVL